MSIIQITMMSTTLALSVLTDGLLICSSRRQPLHCLKNLLLLGFPCLSFLPRSSFQSLLPILLNDI
jgi:hypothetical protein